jgi:hypothetical protein
VISGKRNSQEALSHLCKFVDKNQRVNAIVLAAPHRYDLMSSSCVNFEVACFNRLLSKRMKAFKNVKVLETDLGRDCFTKLGLYLNSSGKDQLVLKLADMIDGLIYKTSVSTIHLQWKETMTSLENSDK